MRHIFSVILGLVVASLLLPFPADGATWYVDNSCGSAGNGTTTTCGTNGPFLTIAAGVAAATTAGDVVRVKQTGTDYSEAAAVATAAAGTGASPITLTLYSGQTTKPIWKGTIGERFIINHAYWVIDSLDFWGNDINADIVSVKAPNVTIRHCRIHRGLNEGVSLGAAADNFKMEWCYLDSLGSAGNQHILVTGKEGDPDAYTITGLQISNNTFRDSGGDCIQLFENTALCRQAVVTGLIEKNTFIRGSFDALVENAIDIKATGLVGDQVKIYENNFIGWNGTGTPGKAITAQHCAEYIWIERNFFDKGSGGACAPCLGVEVQGDLATTPVANIRIVQNVFVAMQYAIKLGANATGKLDSVYVYNNTADSLTGPMFRIEGPVQKGVFKNNLSQGTVLECNSTGNITGSVATNNGWFGTSSDQGSCAESPCLAPNDLCDATDIVGTDPLWIGPATNNYNLASGSTAINAGVNVGLAFNGSAPDLGAKESASGSGPTVTNNIYAMKNGDTKATPFPGDATGRDAAYAYCTPGGIVQIGPGDEVLALGNIPANVTVIWSYNGSWRVYPSLVTPSLVIPRLGPFSTVTTGGALRIVDGVTFPSDSMGIRKALEEIRDVGRGTVIVPAANYLVGPPISIYSNTTFICTGARFQTTTNSPPLVSWEQIGAGSSHSGVFYVMKDASNVHIEGVHIKGGITAADAITAQHGIFIGSGTSKVTVTDCLVDSVGWSGIFARGSNHKITNNTCRFNRVAGIEVVADRTIVASNHTEGNILNGIDIEGDEGGTPHYDRTVVANNSYHDTTGIYLATASNSTKIIGNTIRGVSQRGIYCVASASAPSSDLVIMGNQVRESKMTIGGYGISVGSGVSKFVVASNVLDSLGIVATSGDGLVIEGTASDGIVSGNNVTNTYLGIANVGSGHNIRINNNISIGPLPFYSTATGTNVILSDNTFATSSNGALSSSSYFPTFAVAQDSARANKGIYIGGQFVNKILRASAALDFDLTAVSSQDLTITVTGAAVGDECSLGVPNGSVTADTIFYAWISAANTVTVRASRISGTPNPASGTFKVTVVQ